MSEALEAIGKIVGGVFGLRYIFSGAYRKKVHQRWKALSRFPIFMEIFETAIGVIFLLAILYVIFVVGLNRS